jgi:hypothetical protein
MKMGVTVTLLEMNGVQPGEKIGEFEGVTEQLSK